MHFDLVLKGGHVLDPGQGIDKLLDVGISGGRIVALEADLDVSDAKKVLEIRGANRHIVPGLIDVHTHVAHGATTVGVGMDCCDPDSAGVRSGVTTVVDCGSVGVANLGVFPMHILPKAKTRVICYVNVGSYAHTMSYPADVNALDEINQQAIASCVEKNPGLISGIKLRLVGPIVRELGEELVVRSKAIAREHNVPLMVHIGDRTAEGGPNRERFAEITRFLLNTFDPGDILTHLCTPHDGGVLDTAHHLVPQLAEAHTNGVVLDSALGMGNFGYEVARIQAQLGMYPDTISSDLTGVGQSFHSLVECMAKFMALEYTLSDVIKMTTANAAAAIGMQDSLGAIAIGREADITILDVVEGDFEFVDSTEAIFRGNYGIAPIQTLRSGEMFEPSWGTHSWGWLPKAV